MKYWGKFIAFWEKFPIGILNFLAIISATITIATPIIGAIGIKKLYPKNNVSFIIYVVTAVVLVTTFIIVIRYMVKYRKLLMGTRKVTTYYFFSLIRNFRNTYFDILKYWKNGKLSIEFLTEKTENFLQDSLDDICQIYKEFTCQDVSACIKYIDSVGEVDKETATIKTFARSTGTALKRYENDNNRTKPTYIKDNTDFYSILQANNGRSYFYKRDLVQYAKILKSNGESYDNSTRNWQDYYKSTIVVPICIANKRLFFNPQTHCYNVVGFLCVDSLSTDAFLERDERYNVDIAQAFAAEIYIILNKFSYYLKK